jgi:hypothetical protein
VHQRLDRRARRNALGKGDRPSCWPVDVAYQLDRMEQLGVIDRSVRRARGRGISSPRQLTRQVSTGMVRRRITNLRASRARVPDTPPTQSVSLAPSDGLRRRSENYAGRPAQSLRNLSK